MQSLFLGFLKTNSDEHKHSNILIFKYYDPQIFFCICICVFSLIWIYSVICSINSLASEYICNFIHSILGHPNIFIYFFGPISCVILPCAEHSWPIWTRYDLFEPVLTCLSKDTQIWMINIQIQRPAYIKDIYIHLFVGFFPSEYSRIFFGSNLGHPNILRYLFNQILGIRIYLGICSVNSLVSEYIWIFVGSILGHPIYSDISSNQFYYICS